jgi:pre-rRNA-processing protein IPI3
MPLQEAIFCATAPSSPNAGSGTISLHDIRTGTTFASFKQSSAAVHCTAFVETNNAQGGFIFASQPDKSILNVYNFQKVPNHLKEINVRSLLTGL